MFDMKQSTKFWLMGSLVILSINVTVFLFKDYFDLALSLWVVVLTPAAWLALYFLAGLLERIGNFKSRRHI